MTDRYVFAKVGDLDGVRHMEEVAPAPSPEDWQAIVDAVDRKDQLRREGSGRHSIDAAYARIFGAAITAVRNMREAPDA